MDTAIKGMLEGRLVRFGYALEDLDKLKPAVAFEPFARQPSPGVFIKVAR